MKTFSATIATISTTCASVPQDLARLPCVSFEILATAATWRFRAGGSHGPLDVPIRPRLSVTTAEAAVDAAAAGVGATRLLRYQAAAAIARGALEENLVKFEPEPIPINLIHASRGLMPLKMRSFLDFAAPRLRASLSAETKVIQR